MLAISRPAVALPSASSSMAQASSVPWVSSGQASLMIRWLSIWPSGDQPRTDADEVGKRSVEEGEDCIVRGDSLRLGGGAEDHGLMPLRAPVAHRRGKGRKGGRPRRCRDRRRAARARS